MKKQITLLLGVLLVSANMSFSQVLSGTDFWYSMPFNDAITAGAGQAAGNQLIIIAEECGIGHVNYPLLGVAGGWDTTFQVQPNQPTVINLPSVISGNPTWHTGGTGAGPSGTIQGKALHITSTLKCDAAFAVCSGPVGPMLSVYAISYAPATTDGEGLMPTTMLGTDYSVSSRNENWPSIPGGSKFTVGATEDNTQILIRTWYAHVAGGCTGCNNQSTLGCGSVCVGCPAGCIIYAPRDTTFTITLNRGQTFLWYSGQIMNHAWSGSPAALRWASLTGSRITVQGSSKKIYVIGHADCTGMGICGACDFVMAESLPMNLWGTTYITAQAIARTNPITGTCGGQQNNLADYIEIIGPVGTNVTINNRSGNTVYTIPSTTGSSNTGLGFIYYQNPATGVLGDNEQFGESNTVITSSAPIAVTQYAKGWQTDNMQYTDPEAVTLYPISTWAMEYRIATMPTLTSPATGLVVVLNDVGSPPPSTVFTVNGSPVPPTWRTIGTTTYKYNRIAVAPGEHSAAAGVSSSVPFGIYLDAVGTAESYIVQGGNSPLITVPCVTVPLPVELLSFTGRNYGSHTNLNWTTATEKNSDYFKIERMSGNTSAFNYLDRVKAAGNSTTPSSYSFIDNNPPFGTSYYRLVQVDINGTENYSKVIAVNRQHTNTISWKNMYFDSKTNLIEGTFWVLDENKDLEITVTSAVGSNIYASRFVPSGNYNQVSINLSGIASGIYFLTARQDGIQITEKIVVNK